MKICKICGAKNKGSATECRSCGAAEFKYICERCGTEFENEPRCPECGLKAGARKKICPECGNEYFGRTCPECGYSKTDGKNTSASKKQKSSILPIILIIVGALLIIGIAVFMIINKLKESKTPVNTDALYASGKADLIKFGYSSKELSEKNYKYYEIEKLFTDKGFTNIRSVPDPNLVTNDPEMDGSVKDISINYYPTFQDYEQFAADVPVIIRYFTYVEAPEETGTEGVEPSEETEPSEGTDEAENSEGDAEATADEDGGTLGIPDDEEFVSDPAVEEKLENTLSKITAKKVILVSITNKDAEDNLKKGSYNSRAFHDVGYHGDYAQRIAKDGTWAAKDETTWHVKDIYLEMLYQDRATRLSCDVYRKKNTFYVNNVRFITGTKDEINSEEYCKNGKWYSLHSSDDEAPFLRISAGLIEN